jgi:hypothetical protein
VENIDRISRQGIDEGLDLVKKILRAGITLVSSEREYPPSAVKSFPDMVIIQADLERAAKESELKSKRVQEAWREKQRRARAGELQPKSRTRYVTRHLPGWLRLCEKDGTLKVVKDRARVVKQIFLWAAAGFGVCRIVARLTAEKVPCWSGKAWLKTYITSILRDRRALGEYQPTRGRKPEGPPVPDYYPAVVSEREWLAASEQRVHRARKRTRDAKYVHLFHGLLWNARQPGDTYLVSTRFSGRRPGNPGGTLQRVLSCNSAAQGRGAAYSFPQETFERAILSVLAEVNVQELFPPEGGAAVSEAERLGADLEEIRNREALYQAELRKGDVTALGAALRDLEREKRDKEQQLAEARVKEIHPTSESWKECRGLLEALDRAEDPEEVRVRLRTALRRIIQGIWMVVVERGRIRLCEVLILFQNGGSDKAYRGATIFYKSAENNQHGKGTPARWYVLSQVQPKGCRPGYPQSIYDHDAPPADHEAITCRFPGSLDLRDPEQAELVRRDLETYDLEMARELLAEYGQEA